MSSETKTRLRGVESYRTLQREHIAATWKPGEGSQQEPSIPDWASAWSPAEAELQAPDSGLPAYCLLEVDAFGPLDAVVD
ncbi:MAG: hypothetical protein ACFCVC_09070, partial [Acidimicrobiia bacterium]